MKIVVYGATGNAGTTITQELTRRGHSVIAVSRSATKLPAQPNVTPVDDDLANVNKIAAIITGADAVVSAVAPPPNDTDQITGATERLTEAVAKAGVPRLLIVGGAGSLFVKPGVTLQDSGFLPPEYTAIVASHVQVYKNIQKSAINWTYFSPAGFITRGERTGTFRIGKDDLVVGPDGQSRITYEDYAVAVVDELEKPQHKRARFTIGY